MNEKYINHYLILPADDGTRADTKLAVEYSDEAIAQFLAQGYVIVGDEDFQKLVGNADRPYSIAMDGTLYETPPYVPSIEEVKAAKLQEIDAWTAAKITGGFTSRASGEPVQYDSDKDTQLTMQGIALNVNTEQFAEKYPVGCPVRGVRLGDAEKTVQYLSAAQVLAWCADLSIHIGTCKQSGWEKQAQVAAAVTKEDLDNIILV